MLTSEARQRIYEQHKDDWDCAHERTEIRAKGTVEGQRLFRQQCLRCGHTTPVKASVVPTHLRQTPTPVDAELSRRWWDARSEDLSRRVGDAEAADNARWWSWYRDYLKTAQWRTIRQKVMLRAGGLCEGCRSATPSQVHHLTYERAGAELLFDLVAVCRECHQRAHPNKSLGAGGDD
jgi:hypothetical protein